MKNVIITIFLTLVLLASCACGAELLVPSQYPTIQSAIDAAANGDTIIVAPGTYTGTGNRDIDFLGKAITVRSDDPNDPNIVADTIIDCKGSLNKPHRGFYFHNGEDTNSVLAGFTITNGYADEGGGIACIESSPIISNSTFSSNTAWQGGGICCREQSSRVTIKNCNFLNNLAYTGGGIYSRDRSYIMASNCNFIGNSADSEGSGSGGGINNSWGASCALENCLFIGNSAKYAGAMSNHTGTFYIGNCTFIENTAKYGGGIRSHGGGAGSNVTINNCLFISNSAESGGGAVANIYTDLNMSNSTLWGNSVIDLGGGLYFSVDSTGIINNCVIWGNYAQQYGPQICVSFSSSAPMSSTVSVFYSDVQGGLSESYVDPECTLNWGNGNIDADPCFLNPDSNDFHLLPNSPCINAGDSNYVPEPNETDLDGNPRIDSGRIDMGAYESVYKQARLWISPQVINRRNPSPRMITAWMYLPAGVNKEQVDEDTPLVLYPGGIEAKRQFVFQNRGWFDKRTRVLAFFDRNEFLDALDTVGTVKLTVIGNLLAPGQYFFGSDSIKIISPNLPPKTIH